MIPLKSSPLQSSEPPPEHQLHRDHATGASPPALSLTFATRPGQNPYLWLAKFLPCRKDSLPAGLFAYGELFRFFIASQEDIPPHLVATDMVVLIPESPWPSEALAPAGRYDALKFIDNAETRETVYQNWDDDVFEVSG
ncbi:MAG: hypothetical protein ACE5JL_00825 [Dehalococcoidia bacterium]